MWKSPDRKTLDIAGACALGAFVCCAVAIAAGFNIWWGIVASLAAGYLAYRFRDVLEAVPRAWAEVTAQYERMVPRFSAWMWQWHGVLYWNAVFALVSFSYFTLMHRALVDILRHGTVWTIGSALVGLAIATFGGDTEGAYILVEKKEGAQLPTITIARYGFFLAKGSLLTMGFGFLLWISCLYAAFVLGPKHLALFVAGVFRLVHSNERLLCSIDGTIGGVVAYAFFITPERPLPQIVLAVLFGMALGALWGVLNYEILSKRVLKLVPLA